MLDIRCPEHACAREVTREELRARLPHFRYNRYLLFHKRAMVSQDPNARWCPTPDCDTCVSRAPGVHQLHCDKCGNDFCGQCNERWHPGRTCAQAQDQLFLQHKREHNIYGCPRCGVPIFKHAGCGRAVVRSCVRCSCHVACC